MDESWFDRWTRRRIGAVASGALATAFGLAAADELEAKKRRKKKKRRKRKKRRCVKLGKACTDGGKRCCKGRTCGGNPVNGTFCCKQGGEACSKNRDCCNEQCFDGACALN